MAACSTCAASLGFVPLQAHWATCDKTDAHRKRAAKKPAAPGPSLF